MKKKCLEKNIQAHIGSCALACFGGDEAAENAVEAIREWGIDISSHRSRVFSLYMKDEYELFCVMTHSHKQALMQVIPEEKIIVLGGGIPDPYGGDLDAYRLCRDSIAQAIDELIQVKLSPMTKADVSSVAEIERECFSAPWSEKGIESELENPNARFFTARLFGQVAGYLGMHIVLDECYIANIAVKKAFRRQGVAKALLELGEERARQENCSFISLEVRVSNEAARELYHSRGYISQGERKDFYSEPKENALIMTKFLKEQ